MSFLVPESESCTSITRPMVVNFAIVALALGGTQDLEARSAKITPIVCHDQSNLSKESKPPISLDGSEKLAITHEEVVNSLVNTLARTGLTADRRHKTSDDSVLLEFLKGRQACVDIYPTGEIVVIVREGGRDNVFELGIEDIDQIIKLVRDGLDG